MHDLAIELNFWGRYEYNCFQILIIGKTDILNAKEIATLAICFWHEQHNKKSSTYCRIVKYNL